MKQKIIDLSYGIKEEMSKYPYDPEPAIKIVPAWEGGGKIFSAVTSLTFRPHHGTHLDAPAHKIPGGKTIESYGLEQFVNQAVLIDLTDYAKSDYLREIGLDVLEDVLEFSENALEDNITALLFRTGYDKKIEQGTFNSPNFPYFTPKAAEFIANLPLDLKIVGIDSFAVDPKGSNSESHMIFLSKDILIMETLVNLYSLKQAAGKGFFTLHCAPIKYHGADAAQTRAYAVIQNPQPIIHNSQPTTHNPQFITT